MIGRAEMTWALKMQQQTTFCTSDENWTDIRGWKLLPKGLLLLWVIRCKKKQVWPTHVFFWGLIWFPCSEFTYCLLRTPDQEESTCCMWVAVSDRQGEQGIEGGVVLPQQVILLRQQAKKWCTFSEKAILFTAGGLNDQQNRSTIYPCYSSWWLLQECHFKKLREAKYTFLLSKR